VVLVALIVITPLASEVTVAAPVPLIRCESLMVLVFPTSSKRLIYTFPLVEAAFEVAVALLATFKPAI
jgi:hypothetical protein